MSSDEWGELAASLLTVHGQFMSDCDSYVGFLQGSSAAAECASEPFADDWAKAPSRNANSNGLRSARVAMDNLAGLAILLRTHEPPSIYGPTTLARSSLEIGARSFYLLEPGITPLERIRRDQNARLASLWESKRLIKARAELDHLDARMKTITDSAPRHSLTIKVGNGRFPPFIAGPGVSKPVSATALVNALFGGGTDLGEFAYRLMSAVVHGAQHGVMQYVTAHGPLQDQTHGDALGSMGSTAQNTAQNLAGTPLGMGWMCGRLYTHFGWPTQDIQTAVNGALRVWQRIAQIPDPSSSG